MAHNTTRQALEDYCRVVLHVAGVLVHVVITRRASRSRLTAARDALRSVVDGLTKIIGDLE